MQFVLFLFCCTSWKMEHAVHVLSSRRLMCWPFLAFGFCSKGNTLCRNSSKQKPNSKNYLNETDLINNKIVSPYLGIRTCQLQPN